MNNGGKTVSHFESIPEVCPMSEVQKGIFFEAANEPDSVMYNIAVLCRVPDGTDKERFIEAVKRTASKHKIFNISVGTPDGVPSMIYKEKEITVSELTVDNLNSGAIGLVKPFDLENGPLYRFFYLTSPEGCAFLCDIHHIIFDGTSQKVFLEGIADEYSRKECAGEEMTAFDFAYFDANAKDEEALASAREYFRKTFDGVDCDTRPVPDMMTDEKPDGVGEIKVYSADRFSASDVSAFAAENKVSANAVYLAAFAYTLAKFNGTQDAFFCSVHNGRNDKRLGSTLGMFVKTLPLYFKPGDDKKVSDFLSEVYDGYFHSKKNSIIPFGELAAEYGINNNITFVYQGQLLSGVPLADGYMGSDNIEIGNSPADIDLMVIEENGEIFIKSHYKRSEYTEGFIRSLTEAYLNTVKEMMRAETLGDIRFADEKSVEKLREINRTEAEYDSGKTVVDLFREQAKKTPDNICLAYCDKRFTYREVDEITDRLARFFVTGGITKEKVVGVLIPRCEYMLLASLGILKSGGAYMPLDPTYPPERLNLMMKDSGAVMLVYAPELKDVITDEFTGMRISTSELDEVPDCEAELPVCAPNDLFVMLYTSGSTGLPKGVMFEHSNALVTTQWVKKYYETDESSRVTSYASYGFDAHAFDIYPAITSGAQLHIISDEIRLDFIALRDYFNKNGITHTVMTTQVGRQFALMGGFDTLKHISVAGEKLTPPDVPEGFNLYNLYGPTEGSVITSAFRIDRRYKDVPIGKAVDNLKLYVVDKRGKLLPFGAVGELWISGPHVTRGYLNRPEKTAEAYGENTFDSDKGYERVYRTGDIVRLLSDGNLQFVGRRDAQVKVRGFRIELTEVEEVIRRFPDIKDATVAAFDAPSGGKYLAAYVVSDKEISAQEVSEFIRSEKPPYMVPAVIMQIDKIPLNQNQKVNKKALPVPQRTVSDIVAPENDTQKKIFDIVSGVIGHDEFGVTTDIYEAGLTSIGAVKLNIELAEAFEVPVRIADIKANSTVKMLEAFIASAAPEKKYEIAEDYPISETQNGIFVECMASPDTTVYNIPVIMKIGSGVELRRLSEAVEKAVNAHPYIKTILFSDDGGNIRAKRNDDLPVEIPIIKCEKLPERTVLIRPFTLLGEPLYRIAIYETAEGNYLFMDIHHIICDGTSENIIFADTDKAYFGEELKKESFSGYEIALEEQSARSGERYEKVKEYWKNLLGGCETECLPKKEPEAKDGAGSLRLVCGGASEVKKFCAVNGFSLNAFFNGVFSFVLGKFINKDSLTYATIFSGRNDSRYANAVTMLIKTVPVAVNFEDETTVKEHIGNMQTQLIESMSNDACSFAEISAAYGVNSDIIFAYQGEDFKFEKLCGEKAEMLEIIPDAAKSPVSVNIYLNGDEFELVAEYRRDTFSRDFAEALLDSITAAAKSFMQCEKIKDISMLSEKAEEKYSGLNDSFVETEKIFVHQMLERFAAAHPEKKAITADGKTLTYGEFNAKANIIAHALIRFGIKRDSIVGVMLERSCEIPLCEFAIIKAGGAFISVLPSYPDDRIEYCLTDAGSPCVITTEEIRASRPGLFSDDKPYKTFTIEELLKGDETENPDVEIVPEQLAYCIYTSGSTGKPKGVMVEHHNLTNMVGVFGKCLKYYGSDEYDGCALAACSVSFDASVMERYLPLCLGRHLYMTTDEEFHNPLAMKELMLKNKVQMMVGTPSYMSNLAGMPELAPAFNQLVTIVIGAEAFPASLYEALRKASPELQIVNGYGPSECTICSTYKELTEAENITIGKSAGNFVHYVVDRFGNILPPYAVGELIICGEGVGRGYINLPERNAASFFELKGMRAYHSGDIVRLAGNSEIEFGGRKDNQVKLRGFRVELDEIENVMLAYDDVTQAKVLVRNNGSEDYLVGFFTASAPVDIDALTAHMKASLTYYMVPAIIMQIDKMPLTTNGKIDKNGFPEAQKAVSKKKSRKAPKKSLEQRLSEIFASVLGLDEVYADDNFFELGGTSITASKVTMVLMSENIEVKYGDIFDNPTPEALADFIEERDKEIYAAAPSVPGAESSTRPALQYNMVKYAREVKREPLGNVLLTGAVGFLGIHVLNELLQSESGHIWCLVRRGSHETPLIRLKTMLIYYFGRGFDEEIKERISVIEADITDSSLNEAVKDVPFDTVINCAACVKHFSDSDILERINVKGVENLIAICKERNKKLIQISTTSVPGIHTAESYEKQIKMHENELFVIDDMANKYAISKYNAELRMLDAIEDGLRGKIIRVGNLMGRHSDGEFQANFETNMFLAGIRGFAVMGKYPISHMTDPMRFSPIDCTARAVVLLAGTNDKFTAFNTDNRYGFDEMKVIDACNRNGITILPTDDDAYYEEFRQKLGDEKVNARLNGLAAYDIKDAHAVDTDNLFTTNILYRIGFSWPLVDDAYLDRAINSILTLDYFNAPDSEDEE